MDPHVELTYAQLIEEAREDDPQPSTWSAAARFAREQLICDNMRLVYVIAREFSARYRLPFEEMQQEGTIGLIEAIDVFDWRRGRLGTFAATLIRRRMAAASVVRCGQVHATARQLRQWSEEGVDVNRTIPMSIDVEPESFWELADPRTFEAFDAVEHDVRLLFAELSDEERRILRLRFGFDGAPHTYEEIARRLGTSTHGVRHRVKRSLKRLREAHESLTLKVS